MIPVVSAGPKGVIHDWRKFKLESEDHESTPQKRRELLRQMSNPKANNDDNCERINRK
ncbi:phosducin-like, partial [Clarias magur]